jgi:hypothetical protein
MKCPGCCEDSEVYGENEDGTLTCLSCKFMFDPNDGVIHKMIDRCNGLRSCILTLTDGRDVTLSFPKELEPKHFNETDKVIWRNEIRYCLSAMIYNCFRQKVRKMVLDDEV